MESISHENLIEAELLGEVLSGALLGKRAHVTPERAFEGLNWRQSGEKVPSFTSHHLATAQAYELLARSIDKSY